MKLNFTQEQIQKEQNRIEIEEDDLILFAETLEGEDGHYILTGKAIIEGETYHDFQIEFALKEKPESEEIDCIMEQDWDWYDYLC